MNVARVHLRYRPASDVLSGDIELRTLQEADAGVGADHQAAHLEAVIEQPDADSSLQWRRVALDAHQAGHEYLASFQFVHAAARLHEGSLPRLPALLLPVAEQLIRSGAATLAHSGSALARLQAKVEVVVHLPAEQLTRPTPAELTVPPQWSVDRRQVTELSTTLRRLADAIHALAHHATGLEASRTQLLAQLIHELASVAAQSRGIPSPSTTAAARRAVRGGLALTAGERRELRALLTQLDNTANWSATTTQLDRLCRSLKREGGPVEQ